MHDIRHFRPALYAMVLVGISAFAVAAESPGLWILAAAALLLNAWLMKTGRFAAMPRTLANIISIGAFAVIGLEWNTDDSAKILLIGQGLVFLQLVKLYEQRANRDYAQLLVLSFLLVVASAISTASLVFGLLFILYLFLLLYVSLLFHLKVESEHAQSMSGDSRLKVQPPAIQRDQRYLPSSIRRITAVVSAGAIVTAVVVFIFFPRGAGEGVLNAVQMRPSQALTGFTDNVSFQKIAQITQNNSVIARVELYDDQRKVTDGVPLLLRGSTLDVYNDPGSAPWSWTRSEPLYVDPGDIDYVGADTQYSFTYGRTQFKQVVNLQPTGTRALFAMAGAVNITFTQIRELQLKYSRRDGILSTLQPLRQPIQYTVISSGQIPNSLRSDIVIRSGIDPAIKEYALRPEVCGTDTAGQPLGNYPLRNDHTHDQEIASNFERHLRTFQYTLDLTDARNIKGRDPIVGFLTDFKRGHCEYFAGAMTLMCQGLNIPARVVVGFRCDSEDFNTVGNYYEVKQSNAHAWCEVMTTNDAWKSFDPTSSTEAPHTQSILQHMQQIFDFMEFKWATAVVAYDGRDRRNLVENLNFQLSRNAVAAGQGVLNWWDEKAQWIPTTVISAMVLIICLAGALALLWYIVDQWRLRRRAKRIGLKSLPPGERLRLVRQLAFYDDLLRALARHRIVRPMQLTPLEFSRSLAFLPSNIFDDIHRLTLLFYRVRYGDAQLNFTRHRRLSTAVHRVQQALDAQADGKLSGGQFSSQPGLS